MSIWALHCRHIKTQLRWERGLTAIGCPEGFFGLLLLDVLIGDPPLFPRQEEVELSWEILDPVEEFWASHDKPEQYPAGTQGPPGADALLARDGRAWRRL